MAEGYSVEKEGDQNTTPKDDASEVPSSASSASRNKIKEQDRKFNDRDNSANLRHINKPNAPNDIQYNQEDEQEQLCQLEKNTSPQGSVPTTYKGHETSPALSVNSFPVSTSLALGDKTIEATASTSQASGNKPIGATASTSQASGDKPIGATASTGLASGDKPIGATASTSQASGNKPIGATAFTSQASGDKPIGATASTSQASGDKPIGATASTSQASGDKPIGATASTSQASGNKPIGATASTSQASGNKPIGATASTSQASGNKPIGATASTSQASGNKPIGATASTSQASGDKPIGATASTSQASGNKPIGATASTSQASGNKPIGATASTSQASGDKPIGATASTSQASGDKPIGATASTSQASGDKPIGATTSTSLASGNKTIRETASISLASGDKTIGATASTSLASGEKTIPGTSSTTGEQGSFPAPIQTISSSTTDSSEGTSRLPGASEPRRSPEESREEERTLVRTSSCVRHTPSGTPYVFDDFLSASPAATPSAAGTAFSTDYSEETSRLPGVSEPRRPLEESREEERRPSRTLCTCRSATRQLQNSPLPNRLLDSVFMVSLMLQHGFLQTCQSCHNLHVSSPRSPDLLSASPAATPSAAGTAFSTDYSEETSRLPGASEPRRPPEESRPLSRTLYTCRSATRQLQNSPLPNRLLDSDYMVSLMLQHGFLRPCRSCGNLRVSSPRSPDLGSASIWLRQSTSLTIRGGYTVTSSAAGAGVPASAGHLRNRIRMIRGASSSAVSCTVDLSTRTEDLVDQRDYAMDHTARDTCLVCRLLTADVIIFPCGHQVLCIRCVAGELWCPHPHCRQPLSWFSFGSR